MPLDFKFSSEVAEKVFVSNRRIGVWISGYNSGKTWTISQKASFLQTVFPGYRVAFFRKNFTDLKRTTKQTYLKVVPPEVIEKDIEGQVPETQWINGSKTYWIHIDRNSIESLKSLEINMAVYDQAEDLEESVFDAIDARVGRWEKVEIPDEFKPHLTRNKFTGRYEPPAYFHLLLNPPDEGEIHFAYSTLEPKNEKDLITKGEFFTHRENDKVSFFESSSVLNRAINEENLQTLLSRDKVYVDRFVHGKRGIGEGTIHQIHPESILEYDKNFLEYLLKKAALFRVMDYGASAPTCVSWWAALKGQYIIYREYYVPNQVISYHRKAIAELSGDEKYVGNYADPSIFHRDQQKKGGRYSIADEFTDPFVYSLVEGDAPPIIFTPADNNEFATRNRINEHLMLSARNVHPLSQESPAPSLYFIKKSKEWPNGCDNIIRETAAQKKTLLDTINGRPIYCDDRDDKVTDHGYDNVRYGVSIHQSFLTELRPKPSKMAFSEVMKRVKARKLYEAEMEIV